MLVENLAMQYLTGQLVVSYGTINRFRVAEGIEELIRNLFIDINLRLKMEELVTLDCLFIDEESDRQVFRQHSRTDTGLFSRRNHTPYPSGH